MKCWTAHYALILGRWPLLISGPILPLLESFFWMIVRACGALQRRPTKRGNEKSKRGTLVAYSSVRRGDRRTNGVLVTKDNDTQSERERIVRAMQLATTTQRSGSKFFLEEPWSSTVESSVAEDRAPVLLSGSPKEDPEYRPAYPDPEIPAPRNPDPVLPDPGDPPQLPPPMSDPPPSQPAPTPAILPPVSHSILMQKC